MTLQNVVKSYRIIYCLYSTWSNNNMLLNWCFSFLKLLFRPFQKSNKMKKLYRKKVWLPLNSKIKFKAKLQIDHIEIWSFRKAVGKQSGSSTRLENLWNGVFSNRIQTNYLSYRFVRYDLHLTTFMIFCWYGNKTLIHAVILQPL